MRFPLAIGAVVDGVPTTFQIPLSGQVSPVLAVVPIGAFAMFLILGQAQPNKWTFLDGSLGIFKKCIIFGGAIHKKQNYSR
jgi:hypothetical protein